MEVISLGEINFQGYREQLEAFLRHLSEEVFYGVNAGLLKNLKFDLEQSPFKLLPCLLTGKLFR